MIHELACNDVYSLLQEHDPCQVPRLLRWKIKRAKRPTFAGIARAATIEGFGGEAQGSVDYQLGNSSGATRRADM